MRLTRHQLLEPLARLRKEEIVVTTMGTVRPWARYSSHPLDFASGDSAMGHAADFALGLALAQPERKVICLRRSKSIPATKARSGAIPKRPRPICNTPWRKPHAGCGER